MTKITYGREVEARTQRLLEVLVRFANGELDENQTLEIRCNWSQELSHRPKLMVKTCLNMLVALTQQDRHGDSLSKWQVREALGRMEDYLEILEDHRLQKRGLAQWHFTLTLWSKHTRENLTQFARIWDEKRPPKSKPNREETIAIHHTQSEFELEFPDSDLPLDSPFYVQRHGIEPLCYETLLQPGSLVRIKGPKQMGKTSLMNWLLARGAQQGYQTVSWNLLQPEEVVVRDANRLLQSFCSFVSRRLGQSNQVCDAWDSSLGANDNCTFFFEDELLSKIDTPLMLALDNVDRLFPYVEIYDDFFKLLRSWHEAAKNNPLWKKLRLVMAYSTADYPKMNLHYSPFNVGQPVDLPEFNAKQIQELAELYGLH